MSDGDAEARALRPLWLLTTGAALGALCSTITTVEPPSWLPPLLLIIGLAATVFALRWRSRARYELWLLAGLALVGGRGLGQTDETLHLQSLIANGEITVRAKLVVIEGWSDARWGHRTQVQVVSASQGDEELWLPRRCRLEIRGSANPNALPRPGSVVEVLAQIRGNHRSPLLVVASNRLVQTSGGRRLLPSIRDRLAHDLLRAAGTDANRIRTAEMAAALALGRRDLVPRDHRDRWRRSGLAHLLAVSGLHVGLVGGAVWLLLALTGVSPRTTRIAVLVAVPAYAILAGAAPSAMRAALMAAIYLGARLLGRAILAMAAVLLAAAILLIAQPSLIANIGFQLTVVITAALVRWVPVLTATLFGPRWVTGAVAVPVVAQTAAAPLVAWHFRTLIPGAIVANLLALPLLAPIILGSVAATVIAPLWGAPASLGLDFVNLLLSFLRFVSAPARAAELVTPPVPVAAAVLLVVAGWVALQAHRWARFGVMAWVCVLAIFGFSWLLPRPIEPPTVELLPVSDGAAVLVSDGVDAVLADAGRYQREASQMLAESGRRRLRVVIASHTDEDHVGGMVHILRAFDVDQLIMPVWMLTEPSAVPLLRTARRRGTRIHPVASGSAITPGNVRLEVVWPPAKNPPRHENERSLVARALTEHGSILITADIGRSTEHTFARTGSFRCAVLVVPHHGGRGSTSPALLEATMPSVALIPAAPGNTHGHPHSEVLDRLSRRKIAFRYPARDGRCGARWNGEEWVAFP
ncbi:MAG: DNA internalization-related competence protein ComEC/Rec2 [Acidobacteriota bacterium]|nr:DNA internalization-related competence protein ComEC/Rec2 [Acidobacteriota bacterium]